MTSTDAWYYATPHGDRIGPITFLEIKALIQNGRVFRDDLVWAAHLPEWTPLNRVPELAGWTSQLPPVVPMGAAGYGAQDTIDTIKKLEMASAIVWSIIAGVQVLAGVLCLIIPFLTFSTEIFFVMVAGVWNIFGALSRFGLVKKIEARQASILKAFESVTPLIIIGIVNLLLGAVIGALWVIIDFIIRDKVLKNRHLFDQ